MSWIFILFFSLPQPDLQAAPALAPNNPDEIHCLWDVDCGRGHCWIGQCEQRVCVGYHTCA